ncbi:MAG TPA: glycine--tRNA ligase subunit beta [Gammaproteobacteria bacterium]|nr:glycine--tRNA ligase subunit beta [Gammaproteobacteria bacterium]
MDKHRDFLVEIGTEELPPRSIVPLAEAFAANLQAGLDEAALRYSAVESFATPRRLAVRVSKLAPHPPERSTERRGPPLSVARDAAGEPTQAALAFAESCGVTVAALDVEETAKGAWLVHRAVEPGGPTQALLPGIVERALDDLPVRRLMRWGSGDHAFVRPVHWVVMLFGGEIVNAVLFGIRAGNRTRGHRFLAPQELTVSRPATYVHVLENKGRVIADPARRRQRVIEAVTAAAARIPGEALLDDELIDDVNALVEWPVAQIGSFEARFLELPPEVLVATLRGHLRFFPVRDANGKLMPRFIAVSNLASRQPEQVRTGNERVVRPRLEDAAFFWATDRKRPLASRAVDLERVVYHETLGSLFDRQQRMGTILGFVAAPSGIEPAVGARIAALAKCDLLTTMVGEFPELQGIIGCYYARADGEPEAVAVAIEEQYLPRFAGDRLPQSAAGNAAAIAEKVDTVVGSFAIGDKPTGTRDPFGVRRAAIGVLRILVERRIELSLPRLIEVAAHSLPVAAPAGLEAEVYDFMMERLRTYYTEMPGEGIGNDMFDAVLANRPDSPLDFHERLMAVKRFARLETAASLAAANKRIANILRKTSEKLPGAPEAAALREPQEQALYARLVELQAEISPLVAAREYGLVLERLATLKEPVDGFFDAVMVMSENKRLRLNRLALLDALRRLCLTTADLSRLQI